MRVLYELRALRRQSRKRHRDAVGQLSQVAKSAQVLTLTRRAPQGVSPGVVILLCRLRRGTFGHDRYHHRRYPRWVVEGGKPHSPQGANKEETPSAGLVEVAKEATAASVDVESRQYSPQSTAHHLSLLKEQARENADLGSEPSVYGSCVGSDVEGFADSESEAPTEEDLSPTLDIERGSAVKRPRHSPPGDTSLPGTPEGVRAAREASTPLRTRVDGSRESPGTSTPHAQVDEIVDTLSRFLDGARRTLASDGGRRAGRDSAGSRGGTP